MPPSSRQWVNPEQQELNRLHRGRLQICRNSPFLHANFNLAEHKREWKAAEDRRAYQTLDYNMKLLESRQKEQGKDFPVPPPVRQAFDGKHMTTDPAHSTVLWKITIFTPTYRLGRAPENFSDWPSRQEMKYEGDDRISTDKLHGRFPPAPRVQGNGTVNWQQKTVIMPDVFDNFYTRYDDLSIVFRTWDMPEYEVDDQEGEGLVGEELMGLLGCEDVW